MQWMVDEASKRGIDVAELQEQLDLEEEKEEHDDNEEAADVD